MAKGRILVIDDEAFFRDLYRDLLEAEGYHVRACASGVEALECLRLEEFDLIVTDMEMVGMNGIETTEAIRRFNPDQDVMVVTGQKDVTFAVEAMKHGVTEYLLKPVNPEEFLLTVGKVLFRQAQKTEHQKLLAENIEYLSLLTSFRRCLGFLQVHDLDRLGDLALDSLMEMMRAEGGALWLPGYRGQQYRLRCRRGLAQVAPEEESFRPGEALRRLLLGGEPAFVDGGTAVWVPLRAGAEPVALARIESPSGRSGFNRRDLKIAALVAEFAASALFNVLRYRNLERNVLRVPRSEAYTMAFFRDHVAKELHKARRYGRNLSLLRLSIDNYAELRSRFRDRELEEGVARLIETVNTALRDADIMAMDAPHEFFILLPETDYWGSLVALKRIRKALRGKLTLCDLKKSHPVRAYLRSASFPGDGATFEELGQAAEYRLAQLKSSLFHRGRMEEASFWQVVEEVLGSGRDYRFEADGLRVSSRLATLEAPGISRYFRMPAARLEEILRSFCREVAESNRVRGVLYRGCHNFDRVRQSLRFVEGLERSATSLYLLGGHRRVSWDFQRIVPIYIEDAHFQQVAFLLYLNEDYAYALFARRRGEELVGFHTSDFYFVENAIAKLQEQYQLQAQI
jgi:diguanylate cyclase (GGDEF)-like protein